MRDILAGAVKSAVVSPCGTYRYRLGRAWRGGPTLLFVMLNPSTADASVDDATIRRCVGFAHAMAFGAIEVVNLFAYRATKPTDLKRAGFPVGPDNDEHIRAAAFRAGDICVAWGAVPEAERRVNEVLPLIRRTTGRQIHCLNITRSGYPQHPLMLASSYRLRPFTLDAIEAREPKGGAS